MLSTMSNTIPAQTHRAQAFQADKKKEFLSERTISNNTAQRLRTLKIGSTMEMVFTIKNGQLFYGFAS